MSTQHGTHQKSNTPKMWQKANCEPIDKPLDRFDFHTEFLVIFLNHKSAEANWKLIKQLNNSIPNTGKEMLVQQKPNTRVTESVGNLCTSQDRLEAGGLE